MSTFKIRVTVRFGNSMDLQVKSSDTIQMVKIKIQCIWNVSTDKQILSYVNVVLEDEHTLDYYKIKKNCGCHIFLKDKDENDLTSEIQQTTIIPYDIHLRIYDDTRKVVESIVVWSEDRLREAMCAVRVIR